MTVTPRQVQPTSKVKVLAVGAAIVGVIAAVGGLIVWWTRPPDNAQAPSAERPMSSSPPQPATSSEDEKRLLHELPKGYPQGTCEATPAPARVLAQVNCGRNDDSDGPVSAMFSLVRDAASLDGVFTDTIAAATRVNCPGNIQSPGPWRRNATPDKISGQLFCGLLDGQPTVVWTDEEKVTVSAVRAGPAGPTFPQLYAWWSSHS